MFIAPVPPVPIVTVDRPTQVSAYGSGVLFSKRDAASGRFKLWYTETGRPPAPLPVADRAVPFDGRGCDLFELDLTTSTERKLPASSTTADEVLPAVWKDGLAFARVYSKTNIRMYFRKGNSSSKLMPGGPANGHPNGVDLYGPRLAFGWEYPGQYDGPASDLRMDDVVTARATLIERFRGGGLTTISLTAPAFEGGKLYYAKLCQNDQSGCPHRTGLIRVRYSTGERARANIGPFDLWQARGEGITYLLRDDGGFRACFSTTTSGPPETCTIQATTPDYE